jgi:hypothetical protein
MAFNFIQDFKVQVFEILANCSNITSKVDRIYMGVVQDAEYPFLLIDFTQVLDHSKYGNGIYHIEFEISIFIRDKVQKGLELLLNEITETLVAPKFKVTSYTVAGLKTNGVQFEQAVDLITTKLSIKFKALIKEIRI